MLALAGALTGLFAKLTAAATYIAGRKTLFAAAYIAAYILLVGVFATAINGLLSSVANTAPSHSLLQAGLSLVPSNASFLMAQIGAAYLAAWTYRFHIHVLKLKLQA